MEKISKCVSIRYDYKCDSCKKGYMMYTGYYTGSSYKQAYDYEHRCDMCNIMTTYKRVYPTIENKNE